MRIKPSETKIHVYKKKWLQKCFFGVQSTLGLWPPPHLLKRHIGVHVGKIPQKGLKGTGFDNLLHLSTVALKHCCTKGLLH